MKKLKKIVPFALILIMLISSVACGGKDSGKGSGDTEKAKTEDSADKDSDDKTAEEPSDDSGIMPTAPGELPVVPEGADVTLTMGVLQTPWIADYNENYFTKWVEENTGVNLEFIEIPMDTASEKILLALSTNDVGSLPDVYLNMMLAINPNTIFGPSYAPQWADQGMIIPLNDLIDNHGYFYQEALKIAKDDHGYDIDTWLTSADGNIYSLPTFSASLTNSYPHKMWINQGWLDNLGLKMPTTTDELKDVLISFKNDDPNGNGENDEIPLAGAKSPGYYVYDFIINAFIYNQSDMTRLYVEDGTVEFAAVQDEWREAMKYLRELHDEGLFYAGTFTQDTNTIQQMAVDSNDILGGFEGLGHDLVVTTPDQDIIDRYNSVPALIGPAGEHFVSWRAPGVGTAGVITSNCEYPEVAFRVLDFMMSEDGSRITRYGEKGVNWDDADEGTEGYYGTPAIMKILENTWAQSGQNQNFMQGSPFILDPAIAKGIQWDGDPKEAGYIKAQSVVKLDGSGVVPDEFLANLVFTDEEADTVATYQSDLESYILQSVANFTAGEWDPNDDGQWEAYKDEYSKMGIDEYIEAHQSCYSRMTGN